MLEPIWGIKMRLQGVLSTPCAAVYGIAGQCTHMLQSIGMLILLLICDELPYQKPATNGIARAEPCNLPP